MVRALTTIEAATQAHYDAIRELDLMLPGVRDRSEALRAWIDAGELSIARCDGVLAGFVVANTSFFAQCFIVLLVVHPGYRRRGVASALVRHVEGISPTEKLFTSTNLSNLPMQAVCDSLGFVRSGIIENLDEDDPELIYFKRVRQRTAPL